MTEKIYYQHAESESIGISENRAILEGPDQLDEISEDWYYALKACGWSDGSDPVAVDPGPGWSDTFLMVDLETLDQTASAQILAAAMVNWHPYTDSIANVHISFPNLQEQEILGQTIGQDTLNWWKMRSQELRQFCFDLPMWKRTPLLRGTLIPVMNAFNDAEEIWCQGKDFDARILQDLIRKVVPGYKFPYWKVRDSRDFEKKFGHLVDLYRLNQDKKEFGHNPVMDCKIQIAKMRLIHRELRELGALK